MSPASSSPPSHCRLSRRPLSSLCRPFLAYAPLLSLPQATIAALTAKLDDARAALLAARGQDAAPHVNLIKEIATSIGALRALV